MWTHWEKELTSPAAEEDAKKLVESLSGVLGEIVFYNLIFPLSNVYSYEAKDIKSSLDNDFLQFMLGRLGFDRTHFRELLIGVMRDVYKYIVSDLDICGLDPKEGELITTWSRLLYLLYPVIQFNRKESRRAKTPKIEINIYSNEIISAAVSLRFMNALQMLSLRQHVVGRLTPPYMTDAKCQPIEFTHLLEKSNTLSAPDLAFLAGVSYQYVTKLVRAGKIPAHKEGKFILIPIETAVAFAVSRSTAPKWLRTFADREKIAPLSI